VVSVYNASFQLMNRIQKNKYIAAVDLSEDGKNLLIASYAVGERGIVTEVMAIAVNSDTPTLLFTVEGVLPWDITWMSDGRFVLICDEGVKFYDAKGKLSSEYGFSDKNVIEYKVNSSEDRIAVICREDSDTAGTHLYLLDDSGKTITHRFFSATVGDITFAEDRLILLSGKTAWQIFDDGTTLRYNCPVNLMAVAADGDVYYLCSPTRVVTPEWIKQPK
jgi:hypothetical protein